ncbi:MAG: putative long-chain-fatty-acid--CoA ligase FadD [Pirellulaceae bacterium]|nr:MAG: putative long-chain-fatty-acid--CoA ligase FadD [Pirellulaceae bacterium]
MPQTVIRWLFDRLAEAPDRTALSVKKSGEFRPVTWRQLADDVVRLAAALAARGVGPQARVAQWSENRYEWIVTDFALHYLGAVHVPIHATLTATQALYQINHSGACWVFVSSAEMAQQLDQHAGRLESVPGWVVYEEKPLTIAGRTAQSWRQLLEGTEVRAIEPHAGSPSDLATILYTSGTTGEPKGVMLSQNNLVSNVEAVLSVLPQATDDVRLCFLPLSHIFARTCDLYTWLASGLVLALAESRATVLADAQAVRPTLINAVPYFYERLYRGLQEAGVGQQPQAVRQALGGRIRLLCGGGAALPAYLFDYYQQQECPIFQGYGLTESSPVISISTPTAYRRGASGKPIPGIEVRVADDGEILTRGPHVMLGYYRDEQATRQVIRDGWLYTGDYGKLDEDGFLYITGRKKEIIVTLGGKNVAPVLLESLLIQDPLIQQALVVGDERKYLAALIVPDFDHLRAWMDSQGRNAPGLPLEKMLQDEHVRREYRRRIDRQLAELSHYEQVARFVLLPRAFSIEQEEMTPKLSLRRDVICRHFAEEIEWMYSEEYEKSFPNSG